ncbi:MAG: porin [Betaproteobacteria bacterium]|nr:porin [Betaproteobacteria bacterium]
MNKKLIALAVAGACVAPTAMAQSANPVTLYGRIYATLESIEVSGGTSPISNRTRVADQSSYLGVRGTEDLGGGLKAFFQLETGFPVDNSTSSFASRNSAVGLQGGWGSILMGRWDTPMKTTQTAVDPWGDLTNGDITASGLDQGNFSRRETNSVQYWSPNWSGFSVRLLYTANENKTATTNPNTIGASLAYSKGPIYVAYAYEKHKDVAANVSEEGNALAASFVFGAFKVAGQYGEYERDGQPKDKSYMVAGTWNIGKHAIIGTWANAEAGSADCDHWTVGYNYNASKRTTLIAQWAQIENSAGMNCNFGSNSVSAGTGGELKGASIGVKHVF